LANSLLVSVIVLGYNGREFLPRCLSSVLDQTLPPQHYEVIYADNGSADGSISLVTEQFPSVRLVRFERNLGFAEGNNRASRLGRGRYLVFLNQDTVAHRHWLAEMIAAMASHPNARAGHAAGAPLGDGLLERESPVEWGFISEVSRFGTIDPIEVPLRGDPVPTLHLGGGSMILDPQVLGELDYLFDPTFRAYAEDLDLGLRLNGLGYDVLFVPAAVCYHHREGRAQPSRRTIHRTGLATRNRFVAYMKNMHTDEFLLALPLLFWGTLAKMRSMVEGQIRPVVYGLALLPFTTYYLLSALLKIPVYAEERRRILGRRTRQDDRYWLLHELRKKRYPIRAS
jgi:GT2 family glycosyltransferase